MKYVDIYAKVHNIHFSDDSKFFTFERINIKKLILFPTNTKVLNLSYNEIEKIENLPFYLDKLYIEYNPVHKIENLPLTLRVLAIDCTPITKIENIPIGLAKLFYNNKTVTHVDNVKISQINFTLKGYQAIRRLQIRMKVRYKIKCIIKIQRACHNWVFSPVCKDNTVGIRLRLDLKYLNQYECNKNNKYY